MFRQVCKQVSIEGAGVARVALCRGPVWQGCCCASGPVWKGAGVVRAGMVGAGVAEGRSDSLPLFCRSHSWWSVLPHVYPCLHRQLPLLRRPVPAWQRLHVHLRGNRVLGHPHEDRQPQWDYRNHSQISLIVAILEIYIFNKLIAWGMVPAT